MTRLIHPESSLRMVLLCMAILLLSSCSQTNEIPTLKVGVIQWLGYEPLFLARSLQKYDPDMIKLVELQSSTDTLRLLREGVIDAGALTIDEVLGELALGTKLEIVLIIDISDGADTLLGKPGLNTLADLKGKRIGVESSAVGAVLLNGALVKAGLSAADITIVPLTADTHLSAYMGGAVDALVTFKPTSSTLISRGAIKLFDSSEIPNQIIDVIAVRKDALQKTGSNIQLLIDGYFFALTYLHEHPEAATDLMAPRLGISGQDMLASYEGLLLADRAKNSTLFSGTPSRLSMITTELQTVLLRAKLLDHAVDSGTLFNAGFTAHRDND